MQRALQAQRAQMAQRLRQADAPWARPAGVPLRTPVHPGRFLERQFLKPLKLSQVQAARLLGVSRRRLNEIVVGRRGLSADTALRCALAFGLEATFWLDLQSRWDSFQAWKAWRAVSAPGAVDGSDVKPAPMATDAHATLHRQRHSATGQAPAVAAH